RISSSGIFDHHQPKPDASLVNEVRRAAPGSYYRIWITEWHLIGIERTWRARKHISQVTDLRRTRGRQIQLPFGNEQSRGISLRGPFRKRCSRSTTLGDSARRK